MTKNIDLEDLDTLIRLIDIYGKDRLLFILKNIVNTLDDKKINKKIEKR